MTNILSRLRAGVLHPIATVFLITIAARFFGLLFHYFGTDPAGHGIVTSPLNVLIIAVPYHFSVLFLIGGVSLLLWKLLKPLRPVVTISVFGLCGVLIALGQIDLGLLRYLDHRFTPSMMKTYVSRNLLSTDFYQPLLFDMSYLLLSLGIIFSAWLAMGLLVVINYLRSRHTYDLPWSIILVFFSMAWLFHYPVSLAHGFQREFLKPTEIVFFPYLLASDKVPAPVNEHRASTDMREAVLKAGDVTWLDPKFPILRDRVLPNRFMKDNRGELPDIIIFMVESLRGCDVGYGLFQKTRGQTVTPNLDRLAERAVIFPRYISNGHPSAHAFVSINTGLWPTREKPIISCFQEINFDALPKRLRDFGYTNMILWGSNPSFDNQLPWGKKWYDHLVYELPQNKLLYVRRMGDDLIMDELLRLISAHDRGHPGRPFFALVINAGTHEPYTLEDSEVSFFRADTGRMEDPQRRYNTVLNYLDKQIGRAVQALEKRRKWDNTVIVVVGDHGNKTNERVDEHMRFLPIDSVVWTSALIFGPERLVGPTPRRENSPCSHVDLMPTLLAMVGDNRPLAVHGVNLFANIPSHRRTSVATYGGGYRMDKGDYSLYVSKWDPKDFFVCKSFQPDGPQKATLKGTPFSNEEARLLVERINYWSYLVEQNRVWDASFLRASENNAIPGEGMFKKAFANERLDVQ